MARKNLLGGNAAFLSPPPPPPAATRIKKPEDLSVEADTAAIAKQLETSLERPAITGSLADPDSPLQKLRRRFNRTPVTFLSNIRTSPLGITESGMRTLLGG